MKMVMENFGKLSDGTEVRKISLINKNGYSLTLTDWGAGILAFNMPDKGGKTENVILHFDNAEDYRTKRYFLGSTVGRFANRIAKGIFHLDGKTYRLALNDGENHLHGGIKSFDQVLWGTEIFDKENMITVAFSYTSIDGEEGYPGTVSVISSYTLTEDNELIMEYFAETDKTTPLNITNHAYWNLAGAGNGSVLNHLLKMNAPSYLPVDSGSIPTGEIKPVKGTPFDFSETKSLGRDIGEVPPGYDHCYVLPERKKEVDYQFFAEITDPVSGRRMEIGTSQPGVQLYTGNYLGGLEGPEGKPFSKHDAFCLETQNFPDAVNQSGFPDPFLKPEQVYSQKTIHRFSIV